MFFIQGLESVSFSMCRRELSKPRFGALRTFRTKRSDNWRKSVHSAEIISRNFSKHVKCLHVPVCQYSKHRCTGTMPTPAARWTSRSLSRRVTCLSDSADTPSQETASTYIFSDSELERFFSNFSKIIFEKFQKIFVAKSQEIWEYI